MTRRVLAIGLAVLVAVTSGPALARSSTTQPTPITRPGGLTPSGRTLAATSGTATTVGDCELTTVTCRPSLSGSCTGNTSQSTPPVNIRVLVRTSSTATKITSVPFETYVENVLPNEWVPTWDGDALKAGAIAVKSYAWYWATHYGGYVGNTASAQTCFDVTDDADFQVYKAGSAVARTTQKVQATWPFVARRSGQVVQTSYRSYLSSPSEACGTGADGTTLSQYGSQNCNEANTGYKFNVILQTYYGSTLELTTTKQLRTQHDFAFTQTSTRATFAAGRWSIDDGYPTTFSFGQSGDIPTVNTAGDGFARIGVFRPTGGLWYLGSPTGTVATHFQFGATGDIPVQAQYKGVAQPTQIAVFRPSTTTWYFAGPSGGVVSSIKYGVKGDIPVPGRWLSTSADSIAVFRPSSGTWYVRGGHNVRWGQKGDIPIPADYNGDGLTDIAVYRPSTHLFYVRGQSSVRWGLSADIPVTGDYNSDRKADLVVYRPSNHTWYVHGGSTVAFGATGATPIGAAPYRD